MLWLIAAPSHLTSLTVAADTLIWILDSSPASWKTEIQSIGMHQWRPILQWIVDNEDKLGLEIGPQINKRHNSTGRNPLSGSGITEYPFYAILTEIRPLTLETSFLMLVGQLQLAYANALQEQSKRSEYENATIWPWNPLENSIAPAALSIRRLAEKKYLAELLILPVTESPDKFASGLEGLQDAADPTIQSDRENLWQFIQKCQGDISWNSRSAGGGSGSGGHKWVGGRLELASRLLLEPRVLDDSDDPAFNWGKIDIVSSKNLRKKKQDEELHSDLSPEESEQDEIVILSHFPCVEGKKDLGSQARVAQAKARYLKKANQLMPWVYEGLTVDEMAKLRLGIQNELAILLKQTAWDADAQAKAESLFLLLIMLWTGSDLERATQAIVYRSDLTRPSIPGVGIYLNIQSKKFCWVLRAMAPDYKSDCVGDPQQLRPLAELLFLPTLLGLFDVVNKITEQRNQNAHGARFFKTHPTKLMALSKKWLKDKFPNERVSPGRIAKTLWNQVYQFTRDPVMASCITAMDHPLARVRLFYTTPNIKILQKVYTQALTSQTNYVRTAAYIAYQKPSFWVPESLVDECVGARLCPTVSAVKQMFSHLILDTVSAKNYTDRIGFIRFHNLLTLYVIQFFAYSTSCRAIKTPFLSLKEVDRSRGIAKLSDKDDDTLSKTRLVWLPNNLIQQMDIYEKHLLSVQGDLMLPGISITQEPCFFLDEQYRPLLVSPKTIEPLLTPYLNVRANTHRRFLRTELIEQDCPLEVVDSLMGHWYQGEEPHGHFSSFNFGDYLAELQKHLTALHQRIGLNQVIKGHLSP